MYCFALRVGLSQPAASRPTSQASGSSQPTSNNAVIPCAQTHSVRSLSLAAAPLPMLLLLLLVLVLLAAAAAAAIVAGMMQGCGLNLVLSLSA